jgi:hypothetical protein
MHALHPDIAPETNRCLLQSPFPETATINHRGHQRPLHINICSRFPSMVWHYPYGSLLLHPIKSIVQSLRTLSRASITIRCLALLCIMCRCTSRGAEPNQAIQFTTSSVRPSRALACARHRRSATGARHHGQEIRSLPSAGVSFLHRVYLSLEQADTSRGISTPGRIPLRVSLMPSHP